MIYISDRDDDWIEWILWRLRAILNICVHLVRWSFYTHLASAGLTYQFQPPSSELRANNTLSPAMSFKHLLLCKSRLSYFYQTEISSLGKSEIFGQLATIRTLLYIATPPHL